jgi:predicted dehydrogenase
LALSIKILQVGAGIRGRHWAEFIKNYPDAQCAGLVEPDSAARARAESIIGAGCRSFADLDSALQAGPYDAAVVVSPPITHAEATTRCLRAGLTVMVEKPLAISVEEGRRVLEFARTVGKQVIVAENYRFWPAERTIKRLLEQNFLGKLDNACMIDRRRQPSGGEGQWLAKMEYPQLQDIATHHFDSMRGFFGSRPSSITVRAWNPPGSDYAHGAHTEAFVDFDAMRVQYVGTMLSHRYGFSLWIEGEKGVLWTNRKYVAFRPGGSRWFRPMRNDKVPPGDEKSYPQAGTTSLLNSLRDAVRNGTAAETNGEDNIWTVAMIDAGKISDRERRTVDMSEIFRGIGS